MNILIVDDNVDVLDFFQLFFKKEGYETAVASNGMEALDKLKMKKYDLVLLDLKMPVLNGVGTLEYIKRDYTDVKVIIITGEKECEKEKTVKEMGVFYVMHKPFKLNELRMMLKKASEKRD